MRKLSSILSVVGLYTLSACAGGETTPNTQGDTQDVTAARQITFAAFQTAMTEAKRRVETGDCFTVASEAQKLTLTAKENNQSAKVVVPSSAKIMLSKRTSSDGSFTNTYKIEGVGEVTETSADDAFESVKVESSTPRASANCEVDF